MIFPSRKLSRLGGTTLIEVLVVIVVFLVGILAIAQIFPGGIKILNRARNNSVAVALARSALATLQSRPDMVPEAILPVRYQLIMGVYTPVVDSTMSNTEYTPAGTAIGQNGIIPESNRPWQLTAGPNSFRRVIGETHQFTAPRYLTTSTTPSLSDTFGSLATLEYGPLDYTGGAQLPGQLLVYGRDMFRRIAKSNADYVGLRNYEYGVGNQDSNLIEIAFPTTATVGGEFRVSLTATINNAGTIFTRTLTSQIVPIGTSASGFVVVPVSAIPGVLNPGENLVNVEINSLRVSRLFRQILMTDPWDANDMFTYRVMNPIIGHLVFNPALYGKYEERAGTSRQPYVARVDYDVRDWRILHEDFRISTSSPAGLPKVLKLAVPSIRTNSVKGPDGLSAPAHNPSPPPGQLPNQGMEDVVFFNNSTITGANTTDADNIVIIDMETGGQLTETVAGVTPTMKIDKTNGYITLLDIDNNDANGLTQQIACYGSLVSTNITGRVLRVYYMAREDWAVQIARNPDHYSFTYGVPGAGQYYVGGTGALNGNATRIYFPIMDNNRTVSVGKVRYIRNDGSGNKEAVFTGSQMRIKFRTGDSITQAMPSIDLMDIDRYAVGIVQDTSTAESKVFSISDVRGVSVLAKVFFNNGAFNLTANTTNNLNTGFGNWAKEWSVTTKETYLHRGDAIQ